MPRLSRLSRLVPLALAAALALAIPVQAGLFVPAEEVLMSPTVAATKETTDIDASCPGGMRVGFGKRDIIPGDLQPDGSWKMWMEPFEDVNGNGVYDAYDPTDPGTAPGEPFTDENGNGKWDAPFMAGYGHKKSGNTYYVADGVHDPVWARVIAISCDGQTLGLVSVDTVGLFRGFVLGVRAAAPAGYDHIVVASTHTHDSFDTMGLWGAHQLSDGKHPRAMQKVHDSIVAALEEALATGKRVDAVRAASAHTRDVIPVHGTLQTDLRDPFVLDDKVVGMQFLFDGRVVATMVNWAPHPETLAGTDSQLSSDYAHYLREALEARFGGDAIFFSGAVGGMMTTLGAKPRYPDGSLVPDHSYEKARVIGEVAAGIVGDALAAAPTSWPDALGTRTRLFNVPADNAFLLAINAAGVLDHETALLGVEIPTLGPGIAAPVPFLRAEISVIELGAGGENVLQALTVPGELLPEVAYGNPLRTEGEPSLETCFAFNPEKLLWNGDRNGKWNPATGMKESGYERILAAKPHYPKEPAFATMTDAREIMLIGLANDELGYMVSANDFEPATYAPEVYSDGRDRCGDDDHYEETNSASSMLAMAVANNFAQMLDPSFTPAPMPKEVAGLLPGGLGVWADTNPSGGYEENEDARVEVPGIPGGLPACWGFLNGHSQDVGHEPSDETRGLWVDGNGDCRLSPGDGVVFADMWALSEGQPRWRP